jgi:hypothetical protein
MISLIDPTLPDHGLIINLRTTSTAWLQWSAAGLMIAHQDRAVHTDRKPVRELTEKLHKETIARLVRKDRSSFHSAIDAIDDMEPPYKAA